MKYPYLLDETLSVLIQSNFCYVLSTDLEGHINYFNQKTIEQHPEWQRKLPNMLFTDLLSEEDKLRYGRAVKKSLEDISLPVTQALHSFLEPLQATLPIHFSISVIKDDMYEPIGLLLIGQDISVKAEKNIDTQHPLQGSNQQFASIANQLPMMVWVLDADMQCVFANESVTKHFQVNQQLELGRGFMKRLPKKELTGELGSFLNNLSLKQPFSLEVAINNAGVDEWIHLHLSPQFNLDCQFSGYLIYGTDISHVHQAANAISQQNDLIRVLNKEFVRFKKIASCTNQSIVLTNTINQITWINNAFTDLMGYELTEIVGQQDFQLFSGTDTDLEDIDSIKSSICNISSIKKEMVLYNKGSQKIWIEYIKEPIFDEQQVFTGFLIILNDVSVRKVSETEAAKQLVSLKKMSFIASHEIRHEFSKIMQVTQTIKLQKPDIQVYQKLLAEIEKSTDKMNAAIYELNNQINFATSNSISLDAYLHQEIEEIVLIDDDGLVNEMNKVVIRSVFPDMPVKVFNEVDYAISHINAHPFTRRKIIVDLNFPHKSGWNFLDEYQKLDQPWSVVVLTSSLQQEDIERSKGYRFVTHFMTKPLNQTQLKGLRILASKKLRVA